MYPNFEAVLESSGIEKIIIARADEKLPCLMSVIYYLKQGYKSPSLKNKGNLLFWKKLKDRIDNSSPKNPFVFAAEQPALILFSGGTTGEPKGVLLSNTNMNALAEQVLAQVNPEPKTDSMQTKLSPELKKMAAILDIMKYIKVG
ncbi:MAG: AMP-binding protein [Bacillota bacterium]|nr:AMP-binding protein [Bacillota bacterium]